MIMGYQMFIYTIIIILLIISIITIMIIPQDQGSAWRHSRGQLLLQRLSRQRFTEGSCRTLRQCHWEPSQIFATAIRLYKTGLLWESKPAIWTYIIWTIEEWVVKPEKRKFRKQNKMPTKGTTVAASQHIGKIPQEKKTLPHSSPFT